MSKTAVKALNITVAPFNGELKGDDREWKLYHPGERGFTKFFKGLVIRPHSIRPRRRNNQTGLEVDIISANHVAGAASLRIVEGTFPKEMLHKNLVVTDVTTSS